MKINKNHKKLSLNKTTIVNLNTTAMKKVLAGDLQVNNIDDPVAVVAVSKTNPRICDEPTEEPDAIAAAPVGAAAVAGTI